MSLSNKTCVPCKADMPPLSGSEVEEYIGHVDGWAVTSDQSAIYKENKFNNFAKALTFANKVGEIAEKENHHPDMELGWGYCNIKLQTHKICGLHINDFIVAAKINEMKV